MGSQQFCLKWNNHHSNIFSVFEQLLSNEELVDVTLACEGLSLKAHKMVLSACSPFFQSLFLENPCKHPIVILKDMRYEDLKAIIDFMYRGEVNITQDQLSALLKIADTLKVKGLAEVAIENRQDCVQLHEEVQENIIIQPFPPIPLHKQPQPESSPYHRRKRGRPRKRSLSDSTHSDYEEQANFKLKGKDSHTDKTNKSEENKAVNGTYPQTTTGNSEAVTVSQSPIMSHSYRVSKNKNVGLPPNSSNETCSVTEEPMSVEEEFDVEPSKLLEQTMTTENVSVYTNNQNDSSLPSSTNQLTQTSENAVSESQRNSEESQNNRALVPLPIPSEPQSSGLLIQETSQDGIIQEKSISANQMSAMAVGKQPITLRSSDLSQDFPTKDFLPENELYMIYRRSQNARQFAVNIAKVLFTPEEMRESNCRGARDKLQLDMKRLIFIRSSVFRYYSVATYAASDVWKLCCQSIDAHCRHERRLFKRSSMII
ncbi:protein tramtrack, beta isoform-like [Centruroides vittatus]|uniref:protein tramtrack, beta isoform-like n=1 Tax=Centruroides vittatus TaxID=120091 RepID=UPI0035106860